MSDVRSFKSAFASILPKSKAEKADDLKLKLTKRIADIEQEVGTFEEGYIGRVRITDALKPVKAAFEKGKDAEKGKPQLTAFTKVEADLVKIEKDLAFTRGQYAKREALAQKKTELKDVIVAKEDGTKDYTRLDAIVAEAAKNARDPDNDTILKAAIMARYDLDTMDAPASKRAMARLYKVLALVPEDHVKNDKLKSITRQKKLESSDYGEDDKAINLCLPRVDVPMFRKGDKEKLPTLYNFFNETTLHEVGHAVDASKKFMSTHKTADYGAWDTHTVDVVADEIAKHHKLYDFKPALPKAVLLDLVKSALDTGEPEMPKPVKEDSAAQIVPILDNLSGGQKTALDEWLTASRHYSTVANEGRRAAMTTFLEKSKAVEAQFTGKIGDKITAQMSPVMNRLGNDADLDAIMKMVRDRLAYAATPLTEKQIKALKSHDAVAHALAIRLKGESDGLWEGGESKAKKYAIGTRVYQESYKGQWESYDIGARAAGISGYQFRANGEWFAELYGAAYGGTLGNSHPAWKWLEADGIASREDIAKKRAA